ncbi:MAG: DUF5631 domain-containing protein [Mycobacterium sp.]
MADLPAGEWTALLVGHQWPGADTLGSLLGAAARRGDLASTFDDYGNTLRGVRTAHLETQDGRTAEEIRQAFRRGETRAREISAASDAKQKAYRSARQCAEDLRTDLADIAAAGNAAIRRILDSEGPAAQKVSAIVETVTAAQLDANSRAAMHSAGVFDAIQSVLDAHGETSSAREFARTNGVDLLSAFGSPDTETIRTSVGRLVNPQAELGAGHPAEPVSTPPAGSGGFAVDEPAGDAPIAVGGGRHSGSDGPIPSATSTSLNDRPAPAAVETGDLPDDGARSPDRTVARLAAPSLAASTEMHPLDEAHTVNEARPFVADPESAGADASGPSAPAQGHPADGVAAPSAPLPVRPAGPPTFPAPAAPVPGPHPGAMPAYGADLRPSAPLAPSTAAVFPPAPGAPTTATGGAPGPAANPALVGRPTRQRAAAATTVSERAVATAPAAPHPAYRLLAAVARQQPRLRWAVGEKPEGGMVLATDLAGGWIPPGLAIPIGLELPAPRARCADLDVILGPAILAAVYEPGQPLASIADTDPVQTSENSRWAPAVEDLGWELSRATKWREGLPRLAHTLARALSARTGWLDSEVALLRRHLQDVAEAVLRGYPDHVPAVGLGTWQLLATVDAAISGEKALANYHLAWFSAQTSAARDLRR